MSVHIDGVQFCRPADDNVTLTLADLKLPRQSLLAAKDLRLRSEELRTEQDKVLNLHEEVMERVLCLLCCAQACRGIETADGVT